MGDDQAISHEWDPLEWQSYLNQLLSVHHSLIGQSYQRIPDRGGDHGLEGFSTSGIGYQAYADQHTETKEERTRKQKQKVYDDLKKLDKYSKFWVQTLQGVRLKEWNLVVPVYEDKEVLKYARQRATALRKKKLPFIAARFQATVMTAEDFPKAKQSLEVPHLPKSSIPLRPASNEAISEFVSQRADFVENIDSKLGKVRPKLEDAESSRNQFLNWHLEAENFLKDLGEKFPPLWERVDELIQSKAGSVSTDEPFDERTAPRRLKETREELAAELKESFSFLAPGQVTTLSWGTVSAWLGECPLDFPEQGNG